MTNLAAAGAAIMAEEHALEEAMHVAAVKVGRAGRAFGAENPAEYVVFFPHGLPKKIMENMGRNIRNG